MIVRRLAALLAAIATLAPAPGGANVLYRSVAPNGTITFSDAPPEGNTKIQEVRIAGASSTATPVAEATPVAQLDALVNADAAVARANQRVDLAEHALALARQGLGSYRDALRLNGGPPASLTEAQRVEFYKRDVLLARQSLLEVLSQRSRQ